jgi:hypothetical protein
MNKNHDKSAINAVSNLSVAIGRDLFNRKTGLYGKNVKGIADLVSCIIIAKSCNSGDLIPILPRDCDKKSKERHISRLLSNDKIAPIHIMKSYVGDLVKIQDDKKQIIILMLDQSQIADDFQCLMVSMRIGDRAVPVAWKVVKTKGNIGFEIQNELLLQVYDMFSENSSVILLADRFYGTHSLVSWCKQHNWQYRIRLKGNLIFEHEGREITAKELLKMGEESVINAKFNKSDCVTNIGMIWEKGHKEGWIIAMDAKPSKYKTLDYGMRWGIECMFSDLKSRGFDVTKTNLRHEDRIERLILLLTIAIYWAVSTGMQPAKESEKHTKKN